MNNLKLLLIFMIIALAGLAVAIINFYIVNMPK